MSNLPIRRVVLYKHGVGYFERDAAIEGDQSLILSFKQREVSDVLKSLTVLDLDGGTVSAVSYDSTTPIEQLLAEIALSIPDSGSLVGLLSQLKGARASIKPTGSATIEGSILGIDTVETRTDAGTIKQIRLSLLTDSADIRTFDLFDLEFTLLDEGLKRDLDFYLKTQLASKKKDARTFTLFAQGEGKRTVRVSYVLEAPVWKATYRILLNDDSSTVPENVEAHAIESPEKQPLIQGWAVVDNTSDEDWQDVDLTLVAGLPVSFVHDLYTPRYIRRPVVAVKETTGVLPLMAEAGVESVDSMLVEFDEEVRTGELTPARMRKARLSPAAGGGGRGGYGGGVPAGAKASSVSSVASQTRERQVGDLFEYGIEKPVTVRRNQSALVPILLKPFAGRSVLLSQKAARAENPIRCVEFENTTGLTLEGGPVTVLEEGSYVGEAMLDTLKPAEKRLVGYAVELAVRVLDNIDSHSDRVTRVTIRNGTLKAHYAMLQRTTYTFTSKSDKEQTIYLDHPRDDSKWKLLDTAKLHETTENYWRFKFSLSPSKTTKFTVQQQLTLAQTFNLQEVNDKQLAAWVSANYLDKATENVLRNAIAQRTHVDELVQKISAVDNERKAIHEEQKRIRENLKTLGDRASEKELRERFIRTLGQQEDRLEAIGREEKKLQVDRDAARARLNNLLAGLEFEAAVPE
jgi:hypothetical protein